MVAKCKCGLTWQISVKAKIPKEGYICPRCEVKEKTISIKPKPIVKPKNRKKSEGRTSSVLLRNRSKFSINNQ